MSYKLFIVFVSSWFRMTGKLHYRHTDGTGKVEMTGGQVGCFPLEHVIGALRSPQPCQPAMCPVRPGFAPCSAIPVLSAVDQRQQNIKYTCHGRSVRKSVTKTVKKRFSNFHNQQTWQKLYVPMFPMPTIPTILTSPLSAAPSVERKQKQVSNTNANTTKMKWHKLAA